MTSVLVLMRFVQSGSRPILPLYIEELDSYTDARAASLAGLAFGLMGLTSAISSMLLGRRGDRVGHQKILVACLIGSAVVFYFPMAAVMNAWQVIVLAGVFWIRAWQACYPRPTPSSPPPPRPSAVDRLRLYRFRRFARRLLRPLVGAGLAAAVGFRFAFAVLALTWLVTVVAHPLEPVQRPPPPSRTPSSQSGSMIR